MVVNELPATKMKVSAEQARRLADDFAWSNLGNLIAAGSPRRAVSPLGSVWVIPLIYSNASFGPIGSVGVVLVDDELSQLIAWTPIEEIKAAAAELFEARQKEIWAVFESALATAEL